METLGIMMGLGMKTGNDYLRDGRSNALPIANVKCEDPGVHARHLDVSKDTVCRWLEHRAMPGNKVGRAWKFKISEVDDWVRAGKARDPDDKKE